MKKLALLLSLVLLVSLAIAMQFSACLPPPSVMGFNVDDANYSGSFGNYSVHVHVFPQPSSITVDGPDADLIALSNEMHLLEQSHMLSTPCNTSRIQIYSYSRYACAPSGSWVDEAQTGLCAAQGAAPLITPTAAANPVSPPVPAPKEQRAAANSPSAAGEVMKSNAPSGQNAETPGAGTAQSAPSAPVAQEQPIINAEQILPIVAALLIVMIISFLILQQRQETVQLEITAQDERLLQNGTRAGIMNELEGADRIPTDLSSKLGKSKATIVEHLGTLREAGFVERVATPGKKFVYYRLTHKGKAVMIRRAG